MPVEADHVYLIPPKKEMIISGGRLLLSERDRAAGADAADRRVLPLARAGLRPRARRDRALGRRQRRLARHPRRPRRRRPRDRAGRRERAVRRHAADRARRRRRRLRARRRRRCRACSLEHVEPASGSRAPRAAPRSREAHGDRAPSTGCSRTSSASTSRTTSRARSRAGSSGASRSRARTTSTSTSSACSSERDELDVLYRDLLIGVTRFFRDEEAFEILEQQVLPELLAQAPPRRAAPRLGRRLRDRRGGVLARDPAPRADAEHRRAARARSSRPTCTAARSSARRARHLRRGGAWRTSRRSGSSATSSRRGDGYQVVPELRQMIVFARAQRDQGCAVHARRSRSAAATC